MPRPSRCPSCGAPISSRDVACGSCGGALPSRLLDDDLRAAAEALLKGAEADLSGASSPGMVTLMLVLFVVPIGLLVWGGVLGLGLVARLLVAGGAVLLVLIVIGVHLDGVKERLFERRLRARLLAFLDEEQVEKSELLALASRVLPARSTLGKLLTRL